MRYPHTLTPDQFAIISVALDAERNRVAARLNEPDDRIEAINELRKLWAFSGPIVLTERKP